MVFFLSWEKPCRLDFAQQHSLNIDQSMWLLFEWIIYLWYIWYQKFIWGTFGKFWQFNVHIPSWFAILQWERGLELSIWPLLECMWSAFLEMQLPLCPVLAESSLPWTQLMGKWPNLVNSIKIFWRNAFHKPPHIYSHRRFMCNVLEYLLKWRYVQLLLL